MRVGIDARKIADYGIGTYIRGLLRGLIELGTNDEYVAFAPEGAAIPSGIEHVIIDAPHYSIRELFTIGRAADRGRLDVFHAPHYVVPFTRVPVVVTIHDLIHLHQPQRNPLAKIYANTMLRRAVHKSRVVLTVSHAVQDQLERELGATNVVVTPNGIDTPLRSPLSPLSSPSPLRSHFLYAGNDKPHKNVAMLVEAAKLANVPLVLAGAAFERFGGRGFVSDAELEQLYASAIALVLPSHEEGFGLPALEAMARGTPVVTSLAPALVEVTGDAALHVDARDARVLAAALTRIANDAQLRAALAAKGLDRARAFTWKRCAELTRAAYARARTVEHRGTSDEKLRF